MGISEIPATDRPAVVRIGICIHRPIFPLLAVTAYNLVTSVVVAVLYLC